MPLTLSLKPNEKIWVNGAPLRNGDRRGTLLVEGSASVLRDKDIVPESDRDKSWQHRAAYALALVVSGQERLGQSVIGTFRENIAWSFPELSLTQLFQEIDTYNDSSEVQKDPLYVAYTKIRKFLYPPSE